MRKRVRGRGRGRLPAPSFGEGTIEATIDFTLRIGGGCMSKQWEMKNLVFCGVNASI
jgi:hypothetical protein